MRIFKRKFKIIKTNCFICDEELYVTNFTLQQDRCICDKCWTIIPREISQKEGFRKNINCNEHWHCEVCEQPYSDYLKAQNCCKL